MTKTIERCEKCGTTSTKIKCSNCKKPMEFDAIEVSHHYGSPLDGEVDDFCSILCMMKYYERFKEFLK